MKKYDILSITALLCLGLHIQASAAEPQSSSNQATPPDASVTGGTVKAPFGVSKQSQTPESPDTETHDSPRPISRIWDPSVRFPSSAEAPLLSGVTFHVIKPYEPEVDGYKWLHGATIARHKGTWFMTWGHNKGRENTLGEVTQGRRSSDDFATLTPVEMIAPGSPTDAHSHGVTLSLNGELWGFFGLSKGSRRGNRAEAFKLNETTDKWESQGVVMDKGFWPYTEPKRMENGNYITAGFRMNVENGSPPAVAISKGEDMRDWTVVSIPKPADLNDMWGESALIIRGRHLLCIARNSKRQGENWAYVSVSNDYGLTWTPVERSNMPMAASKPYAGTLSNGRDYLIATTTADAGKTRRPLTIALTDPGGGPFNKIYRIRDGIRPGETSTIEAALAYPYAVEHEGNLYVVYSVGRPDTHNHNSLELAIIPLSSLDAAYPAKPDVYPLWSGGAIPNDPNEISSPKGIEHRTIHDARESDYKFLHGAAIIHFKDRFYANWANSPINENHPHETLQGKRTQDPLGEWSKIEMIAPGFEGEERHSHAAYLEHEGQLWTFPARFGKGAKGTRFTGLGAEAWLLDEQSGKWQNKGRVIDNCWPYDEPVLMDNGNYITGGQDKDGLPVVAISRGGNLLKWDSVLIPHPKELKPQFAETTVWAEGKEVVAVIRGGGGVAWVSISKDYGKTWSEALPSNYPMPRSKAYLGKLSTSQLYLVANFKDRNTLVVAVGKPGERTLSNMWRIRHGSSMPIPRFKGHAKSPQWSYPYAHEHDGKLYIVYSIGKEDCGLSVIPIESLNSKP